MLDRGLQRLDCRIEKDLERNQVFQAFLARCGDNRAVKLLLFDDEQALEGADRQAFYTRIQELAKQTVKGVGLPLDAGEFDGRPACLYPLAIGEPVGSKNNSPLSPRHATKIILAIGKLLDQVHGLGVIHGHISPDTVYLSDSTPFLADFALSQLISLDYRSGLDPAYISPEQVRGELPGSAADIYSLGCLYYFLLMGRPPFAAEDPFAVAMAQLQGEFPDLPQHLHPCQRLLTTMTEATADERPNAGQLVEQLQLLLSAGEIDDSPAAAIEPPDKTTGEETVMRAAMIATGSSDMSARIEAKLKKRDSSVANHEETGENKKKPEELTEQVKDSGDRIRLPFWRALILLLIGIGLGGVMTSIVLQSRKPAASPVVTQVDVAEPVIDDRVMDKLDQALSSWQNGDDNHALMEFQRLLELYPHDPRIYNNLAVMYAARGEYELARQYLEQGLKTDADFYAIYENLAAIYTEMARNSYVKALQLTPQRFELSLSLIGSQGVVPMPQTTAITTPDSEPLIPQEGESPATVDTPETTVEQDSSRLIAATEPPPEQQSFVVVTEMPDLPQPAVDASEQKVDRRHNNVMVEAASLKNESAEIITEQKPETEPATAFLQRWAGSWSEQNIAAYLACYDEAFIPDNGMTRKAWETQRRRRISRPAKIEVTLNEIRQQPVEDGRVQVELIQDYQSDRYRDRTRKVFLLREGPAGWTILSERSLGSVP